MDVWLKTKCTIPLCACTHGTVIAVCRCACDRYANRAKNIKNKPKINEDPKDALLREFQEEIARLKAALDAKGGGGCKKRGRKPRTGPDGLLLLLLKLLLLLVILMMRHCPLYHFVFTLVCSIVIFISALNHNMSLVNSSFGLQVFSFCVYNCWTLRGSDVYCPC